MRELYVIIETPEETGFTVKVTCEKCGADNYFSNNKDAMMVGCINCSPNCEPKLKEQK